MNRPRIPFGKLQSWSLPFAGAPGAPSAAPVTRESDKSRPPATMSYHHSSPAPPGPHPLETLPSPTTLVHPHTGERYRFGEGANTHLVRPSARDESLRPADPRVARHTTTQQESGGLLNRIKKFFGRE